MISTVEDKTLHTRDNPGLHREPEACALQDASSCASLRSAPQGMACLHRYNSSMEEDTMER